MKPSYCAKCGTAIVFLPSDRALVPVDASTVKPSHTRFDPAVHRNHMADCARRVAAKQGKLRAFKAKVFGGQ